MEGKGRGIWGWMSMVGDLEVVEISRVLEKEIVVAGRRSVGKMSGRGGQDKTDVERRLKGKRGRWNGVDGGLEGKDIYGKSEREERDGKRGRQMKRMWGGLECSMTRAAG